jgi:hypothetical protein
MKAKWQLAAAKKISVIWRRKWPANRKRKYQYNHIKISSAVAAIALMA